MSIGKRLVTPMPDSLNDAVEQAFSALLANGEVDLFDEDDEIHIAGDDWTVVLEGDPVADVMVALESEEGDAEELLRNAIPEPALKSLRDLDSIFDGTLIETMADSVDPLAQSLAEVLK